MESFNSKFTGIEIERILEKGSNLQNLKNALAPKMGNIYCSTHLNNMKKNSSFIAVAHLKGFNAPRQKCLITEIQVKEEEN